jgi:hypothetical protein
MWRQGNNREGEVAVIKFYLAVAIISLLAGPAWATTCQTIVDVCKTQSGWDGGFCTGYAAGVWHGTSVILQGKAPPYGYCVPAEATNGQIRAVLGKWLENHPEKYHLPANECVVMALSEAFPCAVKK